MTERRDDGRAADVDDEQALGRVLERLEAAVEGRAVSVGEVVERLGRRSFPAVILVPALLAASPASGIPGLTATLGLIMALVAAQMLWNRGSVWLPPVLARRTMSSARLCRAIAWLRRPVAFADRFLRPRLTVLVTRPLVFLPLSLLLLLALCMPFMEVVPASGSIAGVTIAFFAAALLARDGLLVLLGLGFLVLAPLLIWQLAA